jgi:hypothetical protein
MYSPGRILYFDPFYFKNGNPCKPKYFIVLHNESDNTIIASLPTRSDHVPGCTPIKHGCINEDDINFNCYHFEAGRKVTTNNWSFDMPTFIYGSQIDSYELSILKEVYQVEGVEFEKIGILKKDEYKSILECFSKSRTVRIKFKKVFEKLLNELK